MHILLAAATTAEIQPTLDFLLKTNGSRAGNEVSVVITGIGPVATAWALMRQACAVRPGLIIQAGIAGCLRDRAAGETVVIRDEIFADLGVWEDGRFNTPFDLRLADPDEPPFSAGHLPNPYAQLLDMTGLEAADAITINEINTDPERIEWLRANTGAAVESMEGAALHYVGLRECIPFVQLRSVSNAVGVRDKSKWNIPLALRTLNDHLTGLLDRLAGLDGLILQPCKNTHP